MRNTECSSQGAWVAEVPRTPTNFHHATLCVWLIENDGKIILTSLPYHNLTQDYRKEKEESKETMALEVVTDGKNDKTEKND